jgi:hypothetical protein
MQRHPREARDVLMTGHWQPGRLLVGWSLGVLMTLGLLTATGGWYEYRQLSTAPASGSPARRVNGQESACQVDKASAINVGGYEVVPDQPDGCYLRRPRVRPWQWADGIREQLGRLATTAQAGRRAGETARVQMVHALVGEHVEVRVDSIGNAQARLPEYDTAARPHDVQLYSVS